MKLLAVCKTFWLRHPVRNLICLLVLVGLTGSSAYLGWQFDQLDQMPIKGTGRYVTLAKGTSNRQLVSDLASEPVSPWIAGLWLKWRPELAAIKSGTYRVESGWTISHAMLLFVSGKEAHFNVTLIEGTRIEDFIRAVREAQFVDQTLDDVDAATLREALKIEQENIEGLFLPDTYSYTAGTRDIDILRRAYDHMHRFLMRSWEGRDAGLPYKSPYEVLIMASIIEKETGKAEERPLIASVFINRLRKGMRLQTDPTVIYGIRDRYDGNIRKADLQDNNPWNTYVIDGLPPTPIAMPGKAAIQAALHPSRSNYLYFVAKGGGEHYFSTSLDEHNRAVQRYILGHKQ